uniref:NADH-ubiquinone oxidoreductase chain 6 n=1 Tax=Heteronotia binoei TaxID=13085 RepID=A9XSD4_9SAUR|nr:NADH dehydrogenase subunit 6 [Heteronotia binoei]
MSYLVFLMSVCFVLGLVGVASGPAPFYGAGGLVVGALGGCGVLVGMGGSFIGLVLFLIYLGGMLVVFAYSVALAAEPYPEGWGDYSVLWYLVGCVVAVVVGVCFVGILWGGFWGVEGVEGVGFFSQRGDFSGVGLLFSSGGLMLFLCGGGLLLALFVVMELVRGWERGSLRVP